VPKNGTLFSGDPFGGGAAGPIVGIIGIIARLRFGGGIGGAVDLQV
jgi:hypothetical protein